MGTALKALTLRVVVLAACFFLGSLIHASEVIGDGDEKQQVSPHSPLPPDERDLVRCTQLR